MSLTGWVFIAMVAGVLLGVVAPGVAVSMAPLSAIFLRLVKSIVAPLLFGTLVAGVGGLGSVGAMGRIGLKAIIYFELVTTIALFVGLGAVNLAQPGAGMNIKATAAETAAMPTLAKPPTFAEVMEHAFPTSVIDSMAKGEVLQLVVFCFIFAAACAAIGPKAQPVVKFAESLAEIMFQYTRYVMYLAPVGVGAAIAVTVGGKGLGVLFGLGKLILTMLGALVVFVVGVLGPIAWLSKVPVRRFFNAVKEPFLLAFSTASSETALPKALENMERMGVPKHIVGFVLPTGYSLNLDGSTLYLALASLFVAQAANIQMTWSQQILMMLTLMLTSKGVAAVPRASFVILSGTLVTFGLPAEGLAILLGVDAILDMSRTSVNVLGNCLASAVVARWEGIDFDKAPETPFGSETQV
jgi:proton glutamate symport protein